ncbi:hypothetical protein HY489_02705 [Candidatus Woesearchaeota archaeon]|nr:hypothetical protein [Candidatus Woesearchaeota archaeon]
MNKNVVIAIVLGALVLIAGVQAFQLFTLKNKLAEGSYSTSVAPQAGASGSSPQLPSNLQNLPSMVGGC